METTQLPGMTPADQPFTDDELTALALAADPDAVPGDDAVSLWDVVAPDETARLLPSWYMPSPMAGMRRLTGWPRRIVLIVVAAFLLIEVAGLCSTYGQIVFS